MVAYYTIVPGCWTLTLSKWGWLGGAFCVTRQSFDELLGRYPQCMYLSWCNGNVSQCFKYDFSWDTGDQTLFKRIKRTVSGRNETNSLFNPAHK